MARQLNTPKLVDVLTRYQIYVEGVKLHFGSTFEATIRDLRKEFKEIFFDVDAATLNALTKRQLDQFIRRLIRAQKQHYSVYTEKLLTDLREFMRVGSETTAQVMKATQEPSKGKLAAVAALLTTRRQRQLWALFLSSPMPANGVAAENALARFSDSSINTLVALIRKAAVNGNTPREALLMLLGTASAMQRDGQLAKFGWQANALSATLLQHASNIVQAAVMSEYFDHYRWVSVIDSRTSSICRERDGRIYAFGRGPLPPAHMGCRSHIEPVDPTEVDELPTTYASWFAAQPADVRRDIGGDGKSFKARTALTIAQFKNKLKFLLSV